MTLNYDLSHTILIAYYYYYIYIHIDVGIIVCYCLRNESDFKIQSRVLQLNKFTREYEKKTV